MPPMAEIQAMWWIQLLRGAISGPRKPYSYDTYHLFAAKHQYSVDYGQYVHELARDIGAAPDLLALWWEPRIAVAYGIGQALLPFFRLRGPFRSDQCWDTARTELLACVADRAASRRTLSSWRRSASSAGSTSPRSRSTSSSRGRCPRCCAPWSARGDARERRGRVRVQG
uniref:Uncharacterized protein n=1 Tax=Phaeomonas parva TaxID=124430 RepID=A0A7S1TPH2_9STRA|mmetsp:Transcript_10618/g.32067  ORF Transcript_10618/g.32067 Transcript_10618/m.32067 type:complete len:170 (+) Transcript_10618:1069-1578(+)